jgi:hypothetical protein
VPAGPRLLTRRTALSLGAVALAVAGCDDGDSPDPADASSSTAAADPDATLVDQVLVELEGAERVAVAAGFYDLGRMHRAHIEALGGVEPTPSAARATAAAVRRNEVRLHQILVDAAMAAESGALARLLASMSAAVSQRLAS